MKCFEMSLDDKNFKHRLMINNNMRCFEIVGKTLSGVVVGTINNNMRCFEILLNYLTFHHTKR